MKTISIKYKTESFNVFIDDEFEKLVERYHWNILKTKNTHYAIGWKMGLPQNKQKCILIHRLIMSAGPGDPEVDHNDMNGLNNQKYNMNFITHAGNARHCIRDNKTGWTGVTELRSGRFCARITIDKRKLGLGTYNTGEEASEVYQRNKLEQQKEFIDEKNKRNI